MYKNILIPVLLDEDHDAEQSYQMARAVAGGDAKFTVVHVMEIIPAYAMVQFPDNVLANRHKEMAEKLVQSAKALPGAQTKLISGHAARSILDHAEQNDIDCIVVASHRPGMEDLFIGSTAARVVRHAKCSVHVIR